MEQNKVLEIEQQLFMFITLPCIFARARGEFAQVHYLGYHTLSSGKIMRMKLTKTEKQILTPFSKGCAPRW